MTTAHVPAHADCCSDRATREHHDRLLTVDVDAEELLALLELAVTWHELDYSGARVIGPGAWSTFVAHHRWHCPERAERAFGLALDIVGRAPQRRSTSTVALAEVLELVRS